MFEEENNRESKDAQRKGTRCHICTGCGRCYQGGNKIQVITQSQSIDKWGWESFACDGFLAAVDIGTTTIAMVLYHASGEEWDHFVTVNPQGKYGADVLSRIQAAQNKEAARDMREAVLQILLEGIQHFQKRLQEAGEMNLEQIVIAANTTMIYLLMGFNVVSLGQAPFRASYLQQIHMQIAGVSAVILPGLSAFVGADIMAGIYACSMVQENAPTLFIDLGTNGEMVLGSSYRITACATAAGPAFEGGATKGIWGADMVHLTATLLKSGLLDETGLMKDPYFEEGILIGDVAITQQAIRSFQLAKGAIAAGIELLAQQHGLNSIEQIHRVVLAGGFGYYLNAQDAATVGLIPSCLAAKVKTYGNTALAGALRYGRVCLASKASMGDSVFRSVRNKTRIVNLAKLPDFERKYVESMKLQAW